MTIGRNIGCSVFKRKSQQATCQTGQRCIQTFRMHLRMTNKMAEHRLSAVERTQQPEQRHVRYREVGHSLVAFPTHRHQALQARTELTRQLFGLFLNQRLACTFSSGGRKDSSCDQCPGYRA